MSLTLPRPTAGLAVFWKFAAERQRVYHQRIAGLPRPWTDDPILARHRFTNAYRASDRVSQYLINEVVYGPGERFGWRDTFARVLAFKLFNRIDTWEAITDHLGDIGADAVLSGDVAAVLRERGSRQAIYNPAYIMPPPHAYDGPKSDRHLALLSDMLLSGTDDRIGDARSLGEVYSILLSHLSIGPFLAFQFTIDLNYTPFINFDENDFVVAGPGSLRGLAKCFHGPVRGRAADLIRRTAEQQHTALARIDWEDLWGRPLQLIDVQNLFCEVDKYTRAARPDLCGGMPPGRIKQRYSPDPHPVTAAFPPKWGLNPPGAAPAARPSKGDGDLALV